VVKDTSGFVILTQEFLEDIFKPDFKCLSSVSLAFIRAKVDYNSDVSKDVSRASHVGPVSTCTSFVTPAVI
jgi:hypothetical protein